jgi:uncharacterized protein YjbI with pentapeptide repeats
METKMIGHKIAEARKRMQVSQAQLAQQLFISAQAVGKWERGESIPDIIMLNRLAKLLGVDLNYFSENFNSSEREIASDDSINKLSVGLPAELPKDKPYWDMSRGNWVDADFSGLKNLHDKFSSSNMQRCLFIGSDLSGLLLKNNRVDGCDLSGSELTGCRIQNSSLTLNLFKGCTLNETEFSGSHIKGCDFTGSDLTGVAINSSSFSKNTIAGAVLNRTSFLGTAIAETVFEGRLEDCAFENCAFSKVTFQNATLINTFFKNKSLKRIRFVDCKADKLTYAFLKNGKADMTGITMLTS